MQFELKIKPFCSETWSDFDSLMQTDDQCKECWCLNHREPAGCPTGQDAKQKMKQLTTLNKVGGLLAYRNEECIGWISIDPMSELSGHDCQSTGKDSEWSIHCLFVKDGYRGQGLSTKMISSAIDFARSKGAKVISAFPIPEQNRNRFPVNEAEFSGRFTTYTKLGFKAVDEKSDFYQRMELE